MGTTPERPPGHRSPLALAVVLLATGAIGWLAAVALLVERVRGLENPDVALSCDISPFVSCGALFDRWQASLLGFPNPILGVAGFVAPVAVAAGILAGAHFGSWFWRLFTLGVFGAWLFVTWLYIQSVFVIGVLCPYCLIVWAVTIPMWWYLLGWGLRYGTLFGSGTRRLGQSAFPFAWVLVVANYAVIVLTILVQFPFLFA
ncbi:putative membrane protein [Marisediminicola sp. UYEF4]|uniref:vitamin K epoxide reductase family protein n=1 Tax=Marisediminicola sp. UYEF4 TaxID=1756384 RepID=UPI003392ED5C